MPQGSLAPTAPEAAEQVAPEGSGVAELGSSRAAPAAATPGVAASGVANREAPSGIVPTEEGPRTTPNTTARMPQSSPLFTPISAVNAAARAAELEATRIELYDEVQRIVDERSRLAREDQRLQQEQRRLAEDTIILQGGPSTLPHQCHVSRMQPGTVNPMELFQSPTSGPTAVVPAVDTPAATAPPHAIP
jgi:hypothetical protein